MVESEVESTLLRVMDVPAVSMGILYWLSQLFASKSFLNGPFLFSCYPVFLKLLRHAMDHYVAQWPTVFSVLITALRAHPESNPSNPIKVLELKRHALREMVVLMTSGYVLPVLSFMEAHTHVLDQALLRAFVQFVIARICPPYSRPFIRAWTQLLIDPKVVMALKSSSTDTKMRLQAFAQHCHDLKDAMTTMMMTQEGPPGYAGMSSSTSSMVIVAHLKTFLDQYLIMA
jgi:hypothetical protein